MFTMRLFDGLFGRGREVVRPDADAAAWFDDFRPVLPRSWRAKDDVPARGNRQSTMFRVPTAARADRHLPESLWGFPGGRGCDSE